MELVLYPGYQNSVILHAAPSWDNRAITRPDSNQLDLGIIADHKAHSLWALGSNS